MTQDIVERLYADRDHIAQGDHYLRHVSAMTAEGLHAKSAIAGELAHRDIEIASLRAQVAALTAGEIIESFNERWTGADADGNPIREFGQITTVFVPADSGQAQTDELEGLLIQLCTASDVRTSLHREYMGKAMPDDVYARFDAARTRVSELHKQITAFAAATLPAAPAAEPADPMDWKLPCDVKVGNGTHRKGTSLRTLVTRMKMLHRAAFGEAPTPT